ncbi:MAG: lipoyl synthase [Spirochaetales bacterium]|nr:lipoyl synthase [Spirochaetales bacterium]
MGENIEKPKLKPATTAFAGTAKTKSKRPDWLKVRYRPGQDFKEVEEILTALHLHTVCEEAACPNKGECFNRKTATFMILGRVCTRNCRFCNVSDGSPDLVDPEEPAHIAEAVKRLGLRHVVITSVTRDDLEDGGAGHFAAVITAIRRASEKVVIEVLIPDFQGDSDALDTVIEASPDIINHNVETAPRLYPTVRPQADYEQSLELLRRVKERAPGIYTKSGFMLGLGEEVPEIHQVMADLRKVDCNFLTIGQYLAPSGEHHPVISYITPEQFDDYGEEGKRQGFLHVSSSPLVRSSYLADEAIKSLRNEAS